MNEIIEKKINELYNLIMDKPKKILEIFNDFFGESRVDMQGFMSIDRFKLWLIGAEIHEYIPQTLLGLSLEDWRTYNTKTITNLDERILNKVLEVLCSSLVVSIITDVRFKQGFILVHFPQVRITNEYDKYVDIKHLYAQIVINNNGSGEGYFGLNRSEYSYLHMSSNYMHSHVSSIPTGDFTRFQTPCTGRGPINDTLSSLTRGYNEDLWKLFCLELDKYVQVESIAGTPYHRLESLGASNRLVCANSFDVINNLPFYRGRFNGSMAKKFIKHFINSKKLRFNYKHGSYSIGMSFVEFIIAISNEFIKWYNYEFNKKEYTYTFDELLSIGVIKRGIISGDKLYFNNNSSRGIDYYRNFIGKKVCTFKGNDVLININDIISEEEEQNKSIVLNPTIALYLLTRILNVVNYKYGKSEQRDSEGNTISEKIRYI